MGASPLFTRSFLQGRLGMSTWGHARPGSLISVVWRIAICDCGASLARCVDLFGLLWTETWCRFRDPRCARGLLFFVVRMCSGREQLKNSRSFAETVSAREMRLIALFCESNLVFVMDDFGWSWMICVIACDLGPRSLSFWWGVFDHAVGWSL